MNLKLIIMELCLPVVVWLGLILAVPHIIAKSIVPLLGSTHTLSLSFNRLHWLSCGIAVMCSV